MADEPAASSEDPAEVHPAYTSPFDAHPENWNIENYPVPDMAEVQLIEVLRAVADPIRLEIVRRIADGKPQPKSPDTWGFDVQKSTLSHHFKTLREAGLIRWLVNGRQHDIQLRRTELDERFPGLIDSLLAG